MRPLKIKSEDCFKIALQYTSRSEFAKSDKSAYHTLWRRGLLDQACAHMQMSDRYSTVRWTTAAAFAEAAKYSTRSEFKRGNAGAYEYALANGFLDQCCSHMRGIGFWHTFELMAVAIKYTKKSDFIKCEPSAYDFCVKKKIIDVICAHMDQRRSWTKEDVLSAALKCTSRAEFIGSYSGAYKHADKHGYVDEVFAHMSPPEYGFCKQKAATLYFIRIVAPDGFEVFKVGITNRDPAVRLAGMGLFPGVFGEIIATIPFAEGRDARIAEKRIHRRFSSHRYNGAPLMKNGNSELFTVNVLGD